jgi:hypothetical protein
MGEGCIDIKQIRTWVEKAGLMDFMKQRSFPTCTGMRTRMPFYKK